MPSEGEGTERMGGTRTAQPHDDRSVAGAATVLMDVAAGLEPKAIRWERLARIPLAGGAV
jgi:hypothetical protein